MAGREAVRYDKLSIEDFLTALTSHERDGRKGFLPDQDSVSQMMFEGKIASTGSGSPVTLDCYRLEETDPLSETVETFFIFHCGGDESETLRDVSLSFKAYLDKHGVGCFFRIDPRYGLVSGSAIEPVDPEVRWNKPGAYTTLYLTNDAASPALALLEYVPVARKDRYSELFKKYNGVPPAKRGILSATWKRLTSSEAEQNSRKRGRPAYMDVKMIAGFFKKSGFTDVTISIIYEGRGLSDSPSLLIDSGLATYLSSGNARFFTSLGDLM